MSARGVGVSAPGGLLWGVGVGVPGLGGAWSGEGVSAPGGVVS